MSAESFPIERDSVYSGTEGTPTMWRVVLPNGQRSDMFNLTRAKAAAKQLYQLA